MNVDRINLNILWTLRDKKLGSAGPFAEGTQVLAALDMHVKVKWSLPRGNCLLHCSLWWVKMLNASLLVPSFTYLIPSTISPPSCLFMALYCISKKRYFNSIHGPSQSSPLSVFSFSFLFSSRDFTFPLYFPSVAVCFDGEGCLKIEHFPIH